MFNVDQEFSYRMTTLQTHNHEENFLLLSSEHHAESCHAGSQVPEELPVTSLASKAGS